MILVQLRENHALVVCGIGSKAAMAGVADMAGFNERPSIGASSVIAGDSSYLQLFKRKASDRDITIVDRGSERSSHRRKRRGLQICGWG